MVLLILGIVQKSKKGPVLAYAGIIKNMHEEVIKAKNKLSDLNNHLFAQLERLGDEDLKGDALTEEIGRAKAVTNVAQQIVNNGNLVLSAVKTKEEYFPGQKALPEIFGDKNNDETRKEDEPRKRIPSHLRDVD